EPCLPLLVLACCPWPYVRSGRPMTIEPELSEASGKSLKMTLVDFLYGMFFHAHVSSVLWSGSVLTLQMRGALRTCTPFGSGWFSLTGPDGTFPALCAVTTYWNGCPATGCAGIV